MLVAMVGSTVNCVSIAIAHAVHLLFLVCETPRREAREFTTRQRSWIYDSTLYLFRAAVRHAANGSEAAEQFLVPLQALEGCADGSLPIDLLRSFP